LKALLDTQALIWAGQSPELLGTSARGTISDGLSELLVSAASAWEIATKVRIGKLPEAKALESRFLEEMVASGYTLLPVTAEHALLAGRLVGDHRDPWDRMIAAQAVALDIPVISIDPKLDAFGVRRIW
jgi:PIN domain nuclease of toxin-antitoxin system